MIQPAHFKLCSTCKKPIAFGARYYKCSVSTCNKKATALYFCGVPCWDAHVPDARHRDAWAEEEVAPSVHQVEEETLPMRRVVSGRVSTTGPAQAATDSAAADSGDVLIVMSKLKGYIKTKSELRTSDGVADPLSEHVRAICRKAIASAQANGRTTVLDRDVRAAIEGTTATD
jgi:hypothetical protein